MGAVILNGLKNGGTNGMKNEGKNGMKTRAHMLPVACALKNSLMRPMSLQNFQQFRGIHFQCHSPCIQLAEYHKLI